MFPRIYYGSTTLALNKIKEEFPGLILCFDNNVEKLINSYSKFFDSNNIYIHTNISNEDIKLIQEKSEKLGIKHIILYEDDSFDGRLSLIAKAKKNSLIFDCSYPLVGDSNSLKRHINNFVMKSNANINGETLNYLVEICPILRIKSKQSGSKKEILCYDIDILFKELEKIISYTDKIFLRDIANASFNEECDIFEFIDKLMNKDLDYCLTKIDLLIDSMGEQGFLLVLLSQLNFMLVISETNKKFHPLTEVQEIVELRDLLGKYLNDEYKEPSFTVKPQNPIRIRIQSSKENLYNPAQFSKMITMIVDSIVDLRTSGSVSHSVPILISKLASV
jgi:hypothetical protein